MSKKNVQNITAVVAGVFHKQGKLTRAEAEELSGMSGKDFDTMLGKASKIVEKIEKYDSVDEKYDKFANHLYEEIREYIEKVGVFGI